jgi:NADH-quinone oxidoreductase subunit J
MTTGPVATVVFYAIAAVALAMAVVTISARRMLRAAVALLFVLVFSAGLYVMLDAEFLAGVQVLVYVGGIVVLIVFVVMLTSRSDVLEDPPPVARRLLGALAALGLFAATALAILTTRFPTAEPGIAPAESAPAIGAALLDYGAQGYVVPFEVISILLLAALIGGIAIARRSSPPGQPLTSGGDLPGEVDFVTPRSQRELEKGDEGRA